ncbi:MAG: DUF3971 domain-containing protein [Hyphomicrobiales bacterium]
MLGALATLVAGVIVVGAAVYWRLSQGPISLPFLTSMVQSHISGLVPGVKAEISGVVFERDGDSGSPRIRLKEIRLRDQAGNLIAQAPRAAVDVSGSDLMRGTVNVRSLELIGPRIFIRRKLDGSFQMGFGETAGDEGAIPSSGDPQLPAAKPGTTAQGAPADPKSGYQGSPLDAQTTGVADGAPNLIDLLKTQLTQGSGGAAGNLDTVMIKQASVSLLDEANQAVWFAPRANLTFRRATDGFVLLADATIASSSNPWKAEVITTYRAGEKTYAINARLSDVVPADIADNVFALSQLAQVKLPLSGEARMVTSETGKILSASAELTAAKGEVGFPDYIADPVVIDGGTVRLDYNPGTGGLLLDKSEIKVGGGTTEVTGQIDPLRDPAGRLQALAMQIKAANVNIKAFDKTPGTLAMDRVEFTGIAALNERRLDVSDLLLTAGSTAIRTRGSFVGGKEAVGIFLSGRMRDVSADLVKRLWPAVVLPSARGWFFKNIDEGKITDGTFRIEIPADVLAGALKRQGVPRDMVDVQFTAEGVGGNYYSPLPKVQGLKAVAKITGETFDLDMSGGTIALPSGETVTIDTATMRSTDLEQLYVPTTFNIQASGAAPSLLQLMDQEPLQLLTNSGVGDLKLTGDVTANIAIDVPLGPPPVQQVKVTAKARINNAALKAAMPGIDIAGGDIGVDVTETGVTASGPAMINGQKSAISWNRQFAKEGSSPLDTISIESSFDDAARKKLGIDLSGFMEGPVKAKVTGDLEGRELKDMQVSVDLSKVRMFLDTISWSRPAQPKTQASFDLDLTQPKIYRIKGLKITGPNLDIAGDLSVDKSGNVLEGTMPKVVLDDWNQVAIGIKSSPNQVNMVVNGRAFDARPIISSMFSGGPQRPIVAGRPVVMDVQIEQVQGHRGETLNDLNGRLEIRNGIAQQADLKAVFASGGPINIRITPTSDQTRDMRVTGRDAGAALRATNLYSKVSGGTIDFSAILDSGQRSGIREGRLYVYNFEVLNEQALNEISNRGGAGKNGPRASGNRFTRLSVPFSADNQYVRIGDAIVQGPELGASAQGVIGKTDGRLDIGGTIIPLYGLNTLPSVVPVLGDVLMGGKGQGIFGLNYALKGTMKEAQFVINPVSAIAPGFLRQLFPTGAAVPQNNPDGTPLTPKSDTPTAKQPTNGNR